MATPCVQVEKCEKCLEYYVRKTVHRCTPVAVDVPSKSRDIAPAECLKKKETLFENLSDVDDDHTDVNNQSTDNEFNSTSCLISAIEVRRPLYDHRMSLSKRSDAIKNKLWNEVFVELQGQFTIDELKKKWRYLREKFVRERQIPKSGSKEGIQTKWVHFVQLSFLEDVVTHDKKTTSNLEYHSEDTSESFTTPKGQK